MRVITLGWEIAAPALLENGGPKPAAKSVFGAENLDLRIAVTDTIGAIEAALARGGADENGADVAVLPLPTFVAAYERIRALSPEVFFVVGFSHGREAFAAKDGLPTAPVKGDVTLVGAPGTPSAFMGLFLLDLVGVPGSSVKMVAAGSRDEKDADFFAFDRAEMGPDGAAGRKILLTTADTPKLVPLVAIAPRGLLVDKERAMAGLARGWLWGMKQLAQDPPAGARSVSAAQGAPEPLVLLRKLGDIEAATLSDNTRLMGLSGRGALTISSLFQRTWQLYRGVSMLATPAPDVPPVVSSIVTSLVRRGVSMTGDGPATEPGKGKSEEGKKPLVVSRQESFDEEALVETIGLCAAVFERNVIRVAVTNAGGVDAAKTKKVIEAAEGRFDIVAGRVLALKKAAAKGAAIVEVMSLP